MEDWEKYAIETIDELSEFAECYEFDWVASQMAFCMALHNLLEKAIQTKNEVFIAKIAEKFRHCLDSDDADLFTAAVVGLMEHLPGTEGIEPYIKLFLSEEEFLDNREILTYFGTSDYDRILETVYLKDNKNALRSAAKRQRNYTSSKQ